MIVLIDRKGFPEIATVKLIHRLLYF